MTSITPRLSVEDEGEAFKVLVVNPLGDGRVPLRPAEASALLQALQASGKKPEKSENAE